MRRIVLTGSGLLLSGACLLPLAAIVQQERPEAGVRSTSSVAIPALAIVGVVFDVATGELLHRAQVHLEDTQVGALTDSLGRFRLEAPHAGRFQLSIRLISYEPVADTIEVEPGRAVVAQIGLTEHTVRNCGLIVCSGFGCGDVRVEVRDVLTGAAPAVPVALRVERDTIIDWAIAEPEDGLTALRLTAGAGVGPFEVEVAAPGYATWRHSDVRVEKNECGFVVTRPLQVWLLPLREQGSEGEGNDA